MSPKTLKLLAVPLCLALVAYFQSSPAWGFAAYELPGYGFSNLGTNPNQFASWDPDTPGGTLTTLTYRFAASFTNDNRIRNQVRLAFDQWDFAWFTADGANYSYLRNNGAQPFGDIRSIMVHEVGHALAYHHPDLTALNYGLNPTPPPDLVAQADQNNEQMRSWIPPGAYNQILSHDELDGYEHFYGPRNLNFTEITSGTANILISAGPEASSGTWAATRPVGVQRNAGDVTQGWRLTSAPINFNSTSSTPMGFRTLGINWDYQNPSGDPTRGFEVRTRGTTNTTPVFHYDGSAARHFNTYSVSSTGGADQKNDLLHRWSNPDPGDFAPSDIIHVGVEQDVWDWTVVSAQVVHPGGAKSNAPLLSFHDWNQTVTGVAAAAEGSGSDDAGITMGDPFTIVAQGIRLVNSETIPVELVSMGLAAVDDMKLGLADLNRETLNRLVAGQQFSFFDIPAMTLDNGQELFLVFDGKPLGGIGVPIFLNRPDLIGRELFVFAETMDPAGGAMVGNYALLGTAPIVGVPEPGTVAMLLGAGLMALLMLRRRQTGH